SRRFRPESLTAARATGTATRPGCDEQMPRRGCAWLMAAELAASRTGHVSRAPTCGCCRAMPAHLRSHVACNLCGVDHTHRSDHTAVLRSTCMHHKLQFHKRRVAHGVRPPRPA